MLRCHACIRRTIRTVFADALEQDYQPILTGAPAVLSDRARPQHLRRSWPSHRRGQRAFATSVASLRNEIPPTEQAYSTALSPASETSQTPTSQRREVKEWKETEPSIYKQADLEKELRWLRDPLKLGDRVVTLLREDQYFKALALVRLASKDLLCTVSWNHLVDYDMSKGKVTAAVKTYNEMKKRAQPLDARTYTTLFRGLAWHVKSKPKCLESALSIYHSMFHENAQVKPSIIHTNAVLKVCALAGDMDALLGVAAKLPERGNGAPDTLTYTVILNAVRNSAMDRFKIGDTRPGSEKGAVAVEQGRKLWEEIRRRWVKGDLLVDEELVCAMGRVLLLGGEADADDILSLLEQTMGLPRQIPRLGDPARHGSKRAEERKLDDLLEDGDSYLSPTGQTTPKSSSSSSSSSTTIHPASLPPIDSHAAKTSPFLPIPNSSSQTLVKPGRNTLSLALEACTAMHLPRPAQDYWGLLTAPQPDGYDITPDNNNYHNYLRLLRLQRASKQAVELIDDMKHGVIKDPRGGGGRDGGRLGSTSMLEPKVFRIAMSACVRDKNNPNALGHASSLVRTMVATLEDVDAPTLASYLDLACSSRHASENWRTLMAVEAATVPAWRNLKSLVGYGSGEGGLEGKGRRKVEEEVLLVARRFIALYDKIMQVGREDVDRSELKRVGQEKGRLAAWVQRRWKLRSRTGKRGEVVLVSDAPVPLEQGGAAEEEAEAEVDADGFTDPGARSLRGGHRQSFSFRPRDREERVRRDGGRGYHDGDEDEEGEEYEEEEEEEDQVPKAKHPPPPSPSFAPNPRPRDRFLPARTGLVDRPKKNQGTGKSRVNVGLRGDRDDYDDDDDDEDWGDDAATVRTRGRGRSRDDDDGYSRRDWDGGRRGRDGGGRGWGGGRGGSGIGGSYGGERRGGLVRKFESEKGRGGGGGGAGERGRSEGWGKW